jgi:hypothetical protein
MTEPYTRPTNDVLTRALCLAAVVARAAAEDFIATGDSSPGFDAHMGVESKHAATAAEGILIDPAGQLPPLRPIPRLV